MSRETLAKSDESLREGQSQLQKYRTAAQRLETVATQLEALSQSAKGRGLAFGPSEVDDLSRKIALQAQETEAELERLQMKSAEPTQKATTGAATLGRAEGRAELLGIREDLRKQLAQKY